MLGLVVMLADPFWMLDTYLAYASKMSVKETIMLSCFVFYIFFKSVRKIFTKSIAFWTKYYFNILRQGTFHTFVKACEIVSTNDFCGF